MIKLTKIGKNKYIVNKNVFLKEEELSFYLLGAYMTDGSIVDQKHHVCFRITSLDYDWLLKIRDVICPGKPVYNNHNCFCLEVSNVEIINWLISYGCTPRKSSTLRIEKDIPIRYQRDFLRGVLDGDGSISYTDYKKIKNGKTYFYKKTTVYICSASKTFIEQIQKMIPKEIKCNLYEMPLQNSIIKGRKVIGKLPIYRLIFNDSFAKKLLYWLYYPANTLALPRKESLAKIILN